MRTLLTQFSRGQALRLDVKDLNSATWEKILRQRRLRTKSPKELAEIKRARERAKRRLEEKKKEAEKN